MVAMAGSTATERAAVFKRTSAMLTRSLTRIVIICRWCSVMAGRTEEGKHTGDPADEPESKPSA